MGTRTARDVQDDNLYLNELIQGSIFYSRLGQGQEDDDMSSSQMTQRPVRLAADLFNGDKVLMAACGTLHQVVVSDEGHVYCWGQGGPRLGHGDVLTRAVPVAIPSRLFADDKVLFVACGAVHTAAVTHTGALYTWGFGGEGRLGHGDTCMRRYTISCKMPSRVRRSLSSVSQTATKV